MNAAPWRRTGHIPDGDAPVYADARELLGAASRRAEPAASSAGVSAYALAPQDQGEDESCVGEAIGGASSTVIRLVTGTVVDVARKAIWYMARALDGNGPENVGARPAMAFAAIRMFGYCAAGEWPRSQAFDARPDAEALRASADQVTLASYRILSGGEALCADIRYALDIRRRPVVLALQVDGDYFASRGAWTPNPAAKRAGGHYVCAIRYSEAGLVHRGSYGADFGDHGDVLTPWSAIANPAVTSDPYCVTAAPAPSAFGPIPGLARAVLPASDVRLRRPA